MSTLQSLHEFEGYFQGKRRRDTPTKIYIYIFLQKTKVEPIMVKRYESWSD